MSRAETDLDAVIDLIYEAALDARLWPTALHRLARAVNAKGGIMVPASAPTSLMSATSADLLDAVAAYAGEWWRHDFMTSRAKQFHRRQDVLTHLDLTLDVDTNKDPFFQEFRRQHDLGGLIGQVADTHLGSPIYVSLQFGKGKDVLTEAERRRFDLLRRHLQRAVRFGLRLASGAALQSSLTQALQSLTFGLAIVDQNQKVVFANRRFEDLATAGLRILCNRLIASPSSQQTRLDRMLAEAVHATPAPQGANSLALRGRAGAPLHIRAIPLHNGGDFGFATLFGVRHALVVATRPEDDFPVGFIDLLALGLSPAEAKVAALVGAGRSPEEAAVELANTVGTIRTLLKRIYAKLGIHRQSQLASFVARLSAVDGEARTPSGGFPPK